MARRGNMGLATLASVSRLTRAPLCHDLGFALGPRINAGGRVGKSDLGVRLLTTRDDEEARGIAAELDRFNEERRAIEAMVQEQAELLAERQGNRALLLVAGPSWHPGVIGIVAGRLKEKFGRPAIVIATDEAGRRQRLGPLDQWGRSGRGSARGEATAGCWRQAEGTRWQRA
jgi:single-stranded-DNA-specific exonuclease